MLSPITSQASDFGLQTSGKINDTFPEARSLKPEACPNDEFRRVFHQFVGTTLYGQMLKSMRATQEKNPYFHGGRAEEIFQSQLDEKLVDQLTEASSRTVSEPMFKLMTINRK